MTDIKSLQKQILAHKASRGFNTTDVPLEFMLLIEEVGEAFEAWRKKKTDLGGELADVGIYLMGLAEILDFDLGQEIAAKMEINKKRKYVLKNGAFIKEKN